MQDILGPDFRAYMDEQKAFFERLVTEAIEPNLDDLADIVAGGKVAFLVHEPSSTAEEALKIGFQWTGESVFEVSNRVCRGLANLWQFNGDKVAANWLRKKKRNDERIIVFSGDCTLLLNLTGKGFGLEPGSTDGTRLQGLHHLIDL